jgi:hypothetical protein
MKYFGPSILISVFLLACSESLWASCCGGLSASGVEKLLAHERAAVTLLNNTHRVLGYFDNESHFKFGSVPHLSHWQINHELQAIARLSPMFSPFFRIPLTMNISQQRRGTNLGDFSGGLAVSIFEQDFRPHWPSLNMSIALKIPTGIARGDAKAMHAEQITSMGIYELSGSLLVQRSFGFINLGLGYALSMPLAYFSETKSHAGFMHSPSLSLSLSPHEKGRLQFSLAPSFFGSYIVNNVAQPHSKRRELLFSAGYTLILHSHLSLLTSLGTHLPFDGLGLKSKADVFAQVGLRFGIY